MVTVALGSRSAEAWAEVMDSAGVPCSPVNSIETVLNLPQVLHRQMVVDIPRDDIPELRLPGIAIKLSTTPGTVRLPPPRLGEHTDAVLREMGYSDKQISDMRSSGTV
jgi:crotonobetainyl-CoA:carnitine CoA-transferase CaiB-like acyl-CoA transferase